MFANSRNFKDQSGADLTDYIYLNDMLVAHSGKPMVTVTPWLMLLLDGKE